MARDLADFHGFPASDEEETGAENLPPFPLVRN